MMGPGGASSNIRPSLGKQSNPMMGPGAGSSNPMMGPGAGSTIGNPMLGPGAGSTIGSGYGSGMGSIGNPMTGPGAGAYGQSSI